MLEKSDEELMQLYQLGDELAFRELYRRYSAKIYGYIKSKVSVQADDVFQRVFLKLHQYRDRYSSKFRFSPWIYTITKNQITDVIRAQRSGIPLEDVEMFLEAPGPKKELCLPIEKLNLNDSDILRLRYLEELEFMEIAKRLSLSEDSVRKRISRALGRLRKLLNTVPERSD